MLQPVGNHSVKSLVWTPKKGVVARRAMQLNSQDDVCKVRGIDFVRKFKAGPFWFSTALKHALFLWFQTYQIILMTFNDHICMDF